ncbi:MULTISPECIES: hypothetical protein [unclassified Streptomyces]|uniref:hypothetical protein n=1 Tax=unclassified Streptomyces TaxID=2593676 RepID=UPI002E10A54E|nr:hypothetical protein OG299_37700 [Streptomyces sp. NBC_01296]WSW57474.1 hypothetical protein OG513_02205 [Streptomyces sp. NBC_00998]
MTEREGEQRPPVTAGGVPEAQDGASGEVSGPAEEGAQEEATISEGSTAPDAGQHRVTMVDVGRFAVSAITVVAALVGLVLGIRAELHAGREEQRAEKAEGLAKDTREKVYANLVDFYREGSVVHVVNGNSRAIAMRLTLRESKVHWDLDLVKPCKAILIPNGSLLESMAAKEPSVKLTEDDLAQLRLEFMDPNHNAWGLISGGGPAKTESWKPSGRPNVVSVEEWNVRPEDSPQCDNS